MNKFLPLTKRTILTWLFFWAVAYGYLVNITHDVYSGDIGDLTTAAYFFGVPHPPGYPTLTLLGFLFSRIPIALPIISRISLVSLCAALLGLIFYFKFAIEILTGQIVGKKTPVWIILFIGIFATSLLAFSYLYWLYAEIPEVFALSNCLLIMLYYFAWKYHLTKKTKYLFITAWCVGLSLTNQQAILAAFPGILVFIFPVLLQKKYSWTTRCKLVGKSIGYMFIGLLPYLYLPIAAATNPRINWMNEPTAINFWRMLTRANYEFAKNLVGVDQRVEVMKIYFTALLSNYSSLAVIIGVIGLICVYKMQRRIFYALLIGFIFCGPLFIFVITPGITDQDELGVLERFFMHSFVLFAFLFPFGFWGLFRGFVGIMKKVIPHKTSRHQIYATLFMLPFLVIPFQMIRYSGQKTNLSQTRIGSNLAYDILSPLPKNAVVVLNSDTPTFNSWFNHYVLHLRPDVTFISGGGDRNELKKQLLTAYRGPLKRKQYNNKIDNAILAAMLPELSKSRPVFSTDVLAVQNKEYVWVPRGLTYQLLPLTKVPSEKEYVQLAQHDLSIMHIPYRERLQPSEQNLITPNIPRLYSYAVLAAGDSFYIAYDDAKRAVGYYRFAAVIDPDSSAVYAKLGIAQAELPNQCQQAVENMDTAISLYRIYKSYYTFALRVYQKCHVPEKKITDLKQKYKQLFTKELEKDLHY